MTPSTQLRFEMRRKSDDIFVVSAINWGVFILLCNMETSRVAVSVCFLKTIPTACSTTLHLSCRCLLPLPLPALSLSPELWWCHVAVTLLPLALVTPEDAPPQRPTLVPVRRRISEVRRRKGPCHLQRQPETLPSLVQKFSNSTVPYVPSEPKVNARWLIPSACLHRTTAACNWWGDQGLS